MPRNPTKHISVLRLEILSNVLYRLAYAFPERMTSSPGNILQVALGVYIYRVVNQA